MNKIDSLDFLQACIEQLNHANEAEQQKMKQIYKDEKIKWKDSLDEIEVVLPECGVFGGAETESVEYERFFDYKICDTDEWINVSYDSFISESINIDLICDKCEYESNIEYSRISLEVAA